MSDINYQIRKIILKDVGIGPKLNIDPYWPFAYDVDFSNNMIEMLKAKQLTNMHNLLTLNFGNNKLTRLVSGSFIGLERLEHLNLLGNPIEEIEDGAFIGLMTISKLQLSSMKIRKISINAFEGLINLNHLDISNNKITLIDENSLLNLKNLQFFDFSSNLNPELTKKSLNVLGKLNRLRSDDFRYCCYVRDRVEESNCYPPKDEISSCEDLMRNNILRAFVWLFGISAFLGNGAVLLIRIIRRDIKNVNGILVSNLAISDFLMGFYLLVIAFVDNKYRGIYVEHDYGWRNR